MTAREWLNRGWRLDREIRSLERLRADARDRAASVTARTDSVVVQHASEPHRFDKLVILNDMITARIITLAAVRAEIMGAIAQIADSTERTLLIERYEEFKTWEQIAVDMGYSWRQIHRLHARALTSMTAVIEKMA